MISNDISYDGQVLGWTRYVNPFEEPGVKMEGQEVTEFPRFENFKPILLKIRRSKVYQGRLNVTLAEVLDLEAA